MIVGSKEIAALTLRPRQVRVSVQVRRPLRQDGAKGKQAEKDAVGTLFHGTGAVRQRQSSRR